MVIHVYILFSDPSHIVGLYPDLLPPDFQNQLEFPDKLPDIKGADLEKGILALINYLTQVKFKHILLKRNGLGGLKCCHTGEGRMSAEIGCVVLGKRRNYKYIQRSP